MGWNRAAYLQSLDKNEDIQWEKANINAISYTKENVLKVLGF